MSDDNFTDFVRTNTRSLFRTAYLLTGSTAAAEDLLQETLIQLYPKWHQVEAAQAPAAYVRKALTNRFMSSRRSAASRELVQSEFSDRTDPRDRFAEIDNRDVTANLIAELPDRQRAAIVLRYYHDAADEDIADALGCRATTVRSLISRAHTALRTAHELSRPNSSKGMI